MADNSMTAVLQYLNKGGDYEKSIICESKI